MGRKRQRHQQAKAETKGEGATEHSGPKKGQPWNSTPADLPVRLLALHPQGPSFAVAFAFGKQLAVTADGCVCDVIMYSSSNDQLQNRGHSNECSSALLPLQPHLAPTTIICMQTSHAQATNACMQGKGGPGRASAARQHDQSAGL